MSEPSITGTAAARRSEPKLTAYCLDPAPLQIVPAGAKREWMETTRDGWANRCLPLRVANQAGWWILNDRDLEVRWDGKPKQKSLSLRFPKGPKSRFVFSLFGYGILTWKIPYLFRTPPGYNLLVRGPANWVKNGVGALEGLVETDWTSASFTMNWKLTMPFTKVAFRAGEPICMIVPQRRRELEGFQPEIRNIESEPEILAGFKTWAVSRLRFAAEEDSTPPAGVAVKWQKHYTLGQGPGGEVAPEHQVHLDIKPFAALEPPPQQPIAVAEYKKTRPVRKDPRVGPRSGLLDRLLRRR